MITEHIKFIITWKGKNGKFSYLYYPLMMPFAFALGDYLLQKLISIHSYCIKRKVIGTVAVDILYTPVHLETTISGN